MKKLQFILMRKLTIKFLMDLIINMKARMMGKLDLKYTGSALMDKEKIQKHIEELVNHGYTIADHKLNAEKISEIIKYADSIHCYDTYNNPDKPIDHLNPAAETHVAYFRREDLVKNKSILDLANDSAILKVVQEFLGAKPTISNINMWWSFGGKKQAEHAQLFHRDLDDWRFCKLFVYLTDVGENSGPHVYVKDSSKSTRLRRIRRYKDSEIEKTFGKENIISFMAPKGTAFIVDTYGFHKGLLPKTENRLLLQIQYSFNPIAVEEYRPVEIKEKSYNQYINRLLIR